MQTKLETTNTLTRKIIHHIYTLGGYAWRQSSTGIFDPVNKYFRSAPKKGVADILCCFRGHFVAIEVKTGTDKLRPEQEGFLKYIEAVGGTSIVAHEFESFKKEFAERVINR